MSYAQFYLLPESLPQKLNLFSSLSPMEIHACELVLKLWRSGKKVLLWCEDQQQAERMDDALWAMPESFIPHNVAGEFTQTPTPVEIAYPNNRNSQRRDVVINLAKTLPDFIQSFTHAVDFVPFEEEKKQLARERYKAFRQQGWQLTTEQIEY